MCKESRELERILEFIDAKIESCGSFKDGPEGAVLKSVRDYVLKIQDEM